MPKLSNMFFDTHTHVNSTAYKDDTDETIKRALNDTWMVNVGTQKDTSKSVVELSKKYPSGVFAAIGLHPAHTYQQIEDPDQDNAKIAEESFDEDNYELLLSEKVVAIGECGLDYYRLPETDRDVAIAKQKKSFVAQLNFASKHDLPVIIHCRDAYEDVLDILKSEFKNGRGIIHSFTGDWITAKKFLDFNFYVALNGILAFDKTGRLAEVCKNLPSDKILIETDAPYLAPPPYRGKRNEPAYVKHVAEKIAELRGETIEQVAEYTFNNACSIFGINPKT